MEEEILACIKEVDIKYLHSGQISKYIFPVSRDKAHKEKIPHLIVRVFIFSKTPEGDILFLVQKRGKNKKSFPNYFTDSASGHVIYKKNLDLNNIKNDALRELEEEFDINPREVKAFNFFEVKTENDDISNEIAYIFIGAVNYDIDLKPNSDELEIKGSRFYSGSELEKLIKDQDYVDHSKKIWEKLLKSNLENLLEEKRKIKKNQQRIVLFIGRFQPLHHGHIHVIYEILKKNEYIKIGIGSSQISHTENNPFTKDERMQFIKASLKKRSIAHDKFKIFFIPDIFDADKWVNHVVSITGEFDILYTNSDWMRELFKSKNYEVSKKSIIFKNKYNGTNIRNLIYKENKQWRLLVPNEVIDLIKIFNGIERIKKIINESR